jgi:hypothetical protein
MRMVTRIKSDSETDPNRAPVEIPAATAAVPLRMTREQVVRRIQKAELRGRFDSRRGWLVETSSIADWNRGIGRAGR